MQAVPSSPSRVALICHPALPDDVGALLALARQATPPDDVRVLRVTVTRASPSGP